MVSTNQKFLFQNITSFTILFWRLAEDLHPNPCRSLGFQDQSGALARFTSQMVLRDGFEPSLLDYRSSVLTSYTIEAYGAGDKTRTCTGKRPSELKSDVSTNSTTPAFLPSVRLSNVFPLCHKGGDYHIEISLMSVI